jgi:hypothetical protein
VDCVADGGEGVAQLVGQDRQEFVLAPVALTQRFVGRLQLGGPRGDALFQLSVQGAALLLGPLMIDHVADQPAQADRAARPVQERADGEQDVPGLPVARLEAELDPPIAE